MEERKYLICKHDGSSRVTLSKTEDELTDDDKKLLLGTLISEFNKYPFCTQSEFILKVVDECRSKFTSDFLMQMHKKI